MTNYTLKHAQREQLRALMTATFIRSGKSFAAYSQFATRKLGFFVGQRQVEYQCRQMGLKTVPKMAPAPAAPIAVKAPAPEAHPAPQSVVATPPSDYARRSDLDTVVSMLATLESRIKFIEQDVRFLRGLPQSGLGIRYGKGNGSANGIGGFFG